MMFLEKGLIPNPPPVQFRGGSRRIVRSEPDAHRRRQRMSDHPGLARPDPHTEISAPPFRLLPTPSRFRPVGPSGRGRAGPGSGSFGRQWRILSIG